MRRVAAWLMAALLLMTVFGALAEEYYPEMTVVNCEDWVSLRQSPDKSSKRLKKVPLGATVTECTRVSSNFFRCQYEGVQGYVLAEYLQANTSVLPSLGVDGALGEMKVVNCQAWVSLRRTPSTTANRIAKVPLGATVSNCSRATDRFIYCEYNGVKGYVLSEYLMSAGAASSAQQVLSFGKVALNANVNGYTVVAARSWGSSSETMRLACFDSLGRKCWSRDIAVPYATELDSTAAFIGGTQEAPMVMAYNAAEGLYALDLVTGTEQWLVSRSMVDLGGSLSWAVRADGTMYIGGYYGPDPVAISADGAVLWEAEARHDAYWMTEISLTSEYVVASYDCIDGPEASGRIGYTYDGKMSWVEWD